MSKYIRIDHGTDSRGMRWEVGRRGGEVVIRVDPKSSLVTLDGEQRDRFIKAWAQAEREIEGEHPGQHYRACCDHCDNSEATGHGYTLGGPHDGPCEQCAADKARREHDKGTG